MAYRELSSYSRIAGTSEPGYVLNATHQDWEDFIRDAEANLDLANSYDFETSFTYASTDESDYDHAQRELTQVQASLRPGQAIVSGWAPELLPFYKRLMEIPNPKLDYNGRGFDRSYNRALGIKPAGTYIDLIDAWHHWQPDLPRGLQYACSFVLPFEGPWKHLFPIHPRLYGAFDVDYPQRLWQYLQKHLGELRHPETGISLLDGYWRQVNKLCAVSLDRMQVRGIPVDNDKRREIWDTLAEMAKEVQSQIQDLIPEHLKPAKQKQGLKQIPMFIRKDPRLLEEAESSGRVWNPAIEAWYVKRNFRLEDGSEERRWCQIEPWNPNSTFQVRDYIRWRRENEISDILAARKYCRHSTGRSPLACPECRQSVETRAIWKVPTEFRSDKETTDKKELRRLQIKTRDVVLEKVVELREITKMAGTYVGSPDGKQKGWAPAEDGRAHPFFTTAPATGQLSSKDPNAQNFPKHNPKFGKLMRSMIKAPPGFRIIEADFKAFHVLTTGFEAKDPLYMRLARLDMHSFFAATGLLGLYRQDELLRHSDADLMKLFKELKSDKTPRYRVAAAPDPVDFKFVRDKQAKPTILGYGFGMGAARLYHENQEFMAGIPDAARIIGRLDTGFPVTCAWRDEIQSIAHKQGYLISRHGYIRWFNSVFRYRPLHPSDSIKAGWKIVTTPDGLRWRIENGDDAEAAIAFLPANDAFGHIKEAMIRLEEAGYGEEFGLVNQIHDSLMLVCPSEKIDRCMEIVKFEMEKPSEYLILPDGSGLSCQAEISISPEAGTWAECEEVQI